MNNPQKELAEMNEEKRCFMVCMFDLDIFNGNVKSIWCSDSYFIANDPA